MVYRRRGLLLKLFLTAGVVHSSVRAIKKTAFSKHSNKKYQATFSCPRLGKNGGLFYDHCNRWEDPKIIESINKKYANMGVLIGSSHHEMLNILSWTYIFSDRLSYEDWSREVFLSGGFNPYKVDEQFLYTLEEKYV